MYRENDPEPEIFNRKGFIFFPLKVFSSYYPHFGKVKNKKKTLSKSGWVSMDSPIVFFESALFLFCVFFLFEIKSSKNNRFLFLFSPGQADRLTQLNSCYFIMGLFSVCTSSTKNLFILVIPKDISTLDSKSYFKDIRLHHHRHPF